MPLYRLDGVAPRIDASAYVHPDAVLIGDVLVSAHATIWPGAVLRADYGAITIGERTSVQDGSILHTTAEWPTVIGPDCVVGHGAHLEGCTVEDWCLIASGSIVLNRATIRHHSIVAAGAMVGEGADIPSRHMARGVPAKAHPLTKDPAPYQEHAVRSYVENGERYRRGLELVVDD